MITSVFSKSRPINYIVITILLVLSFLLFQFRTNYDTISNLDISKKAFYLFLLVGSLWLTNFITKKNGLSKNNSYTFLLFFSFLLLFPKILSNGSLIIANTFILLALRRLISIQSLRMPKEKIFDASLWIFFASLFHFWSILFIILVFISILFHVARDYRNWFIPFLAFFTVLILAVVFSLVFNPLLIDAYLNKIIVNFEFNYLKTIFENADLVIYISISLLASISMMILLSKKALNMKSSYWKIIIAFFIGLYVFFISDEKNNNYLVYTFVPVSIMLTNFLETVYKYWIKETILAVIIATSLINYIYQLL
jgi:Family of unknown function (DUF6427)